jgi:hypothetical protein
VGTTSIRLGQNAGQTGQGTNAVALGEQAGNNSQGANAVAVGYLAGQTGQCANSIVISAQGSALNAGTTGACYISPIRNVTQTNVLGYDTTNKEITYYTPGANVSNNQFLLTTGASSGELLASGCSITITAGTWFVQAQLTVSNLATNDSCLCYIYNGTTASAVSNSRGTPGVSTTTSYVQIVSALTVITVAGSTIIYPAATRNGASQLQTPTTNACNGPNQTITAIRIA